jgi:hypothetical protein
MSDVPNAGKGLFAVLASFVALLVMVVGVVFAATLIVKMFVVVCGAISCTSS